LLPALCGVSMKSNEARLFEAARRLGVCGTYL
jgi:hypothetical protein